MILGLYLGVVSRLVPRERRQAWRREWEAELAHFDRLMEEAGVGRVGRAARLLLYTLDCMEDAVGMRMRRRRSSRLFTEVRIALRSLARSPGFALVAAFTLALGIGANTAIFSVVRNVVLRPLPYERPQELLDVALSFRNLESGAERPIPASEPEFLELRAENDALGELAGYWIGEANFGGGVEPVRVSSASVSSNFLTALGVEPVVGRGFTDDEDLPGRDRVVVLTHGLWQRAFGGDEGAVGRESLINGRPARIVGVLPVDFIFPGPPVDLLVPNVVDPATPAGRSSHYLTMVARLAPGVDLELARSRTDDLVRRWGDEYPDRHGVKPTHPVRLVPLRDSMVGDVRRMVFLLQGAVGLVLLIACANVAALMLVRAERRQQETGIRVALGGTRADVAAPVVAESLILALAGTALGVGLTYATVDLVERIGPAILRQVGGVQVDFPVLLFALAVGVGATLVFGMVPALMASTGDAARHLRGADHRGTAGAGRLSFRRGVVVVQIALSVVLVVASGLLLKSFARLQSVDPGFRPAGVVTAELGLSSGSYPEPAQVAAFHAQVADRLGALAGVRAVGSVRALPFADAVGTETLSPTDEPVDMENLWNAQYQVVGPGYHQAMGIPLLEGRHLTRADDDAAPGAAVVDKVMADLYWPGESPVGRRFRLGVPQSRTPEFTVVGVVGNVRQSGYDAALRPTFYVPRAQALSIYGGLGTRGATVVVATELPPAVALQQLRDALRAIDPGLPVSRLTSMDGIMGRSVAGERFLTLLVGAFSALALVLGAVGIGGAVAYTVARRTREFGLRIALGADRGTLLRGVLQGAATLATVGVVVGLAGTWASAGVLAGQLYEVSPRDPVVLVLGPLVLFVVSVGAAWLPARRATRVDPVEAMRAE